MKVRTRSAAPQLRAEITDSVGAHRGFLHHSKGDNEGAIADYSKALALNPANEECWRGRGLAYLNGRMPLSAIADLTRAIALNSDDALAHRFRSMAYVATHDLRQAADDQTSAFRLDPRLAKPQQRPASRS